MLTQYLIIPKMAEESVKTKRDMAKERLKTRYPDREFADDEAVFGQINDDFTDYDTQLAGYKDREKKFSDMFTSDPRSARFLTEWRNGGDPVIMLVRQFGTDIKDALEDPEKLDAIAEANKDHVERVAKAKELEDLYKANSEQTLQDLAAYQQENGLTDEQIDSAWEYLKEVGNNIIIGKVTKDMLDMAFKAINHDADVATAAEDAEVKGRNAKIEEQMRKAKKGDGVAALDGQNNVPQTKTKKNMGALERFDADMQDIWGRGGMNRKRKTVMD